MTYARTNVTSRRNVVCPTAAFGRSRHNEQWKSKSDPINSLLLLGLEFRRKSLDLRKSVFHFYHSLDPNNGISGQGHKADYFTDVRYWSKVLSDTSPQPPVLVQ